MNLQLMLHMGSTSIAFSANLLDIACTLFLDWALLRAPTIHTALAGAI